MRTDLSVFAIAGNVVTYKATLDDLLESAEMAASETQSGVISTGEQYFAGDKYFTDQIWITENEQHGGHIGIVSGSGSLMAPLLGASSETSTYWLQILAHPAPNLYNTNPADGIIFQVYDNEGPDPITGGRAFNFKNGTTSVFNIDFAGDGNLWGGLNMFDNRVSNGAISLGSGSGSLLAPLLSTNSESSTAFLGFAAFPATNIDNTNPTDAFKFNAYKTSDGSTALTGGNLLNLFNKNVSKFSVDYNGVITSAGLTNGLVKSTSGVFSNATVASDYTLLNGTGIVEMAGTTASYLSSTGSGSVVKATSPTLVTPNIGNATGGTLNLSGKITSTLGNNTEIFNSASATTGFQYFNLQNTSGRLQVGIEGSSAGSLLTGGSAYSGVLTTVGTKNLELGTDQTVGLKIDGTNRKVTIPELGGAGDVIVGANNNGLLGEIAIGSGLSLTSGVLTATGGSSGSVTTAGGTAGKIAKFTSASNIENSIMTESSGLISIAGNIESTAGNNQIVFDSKSATTGYQYQHLKNTSGEIIFGIEGSSAGTLLTNGTAYSGVLTTVGSQNLELGTNQTKRLTIAHTTGDITATGNISAANLSGTNTGDQTTITGNAGTATALQTARTIAGVSFDGTANISLNNNAITNGAGYITSSALTPYATLASPTFTGTVSGITAAMVGAPSGSGTSTGTNTGDQNLAPYATLASPALTGNPTAPTQTAGDNSTKIATTAYVDGALLSRANRILKDWYTDANNVSSSPTDLYDYTVPANTLVNNGDKLDFRISGIYANSGDIKTITVYFGGSNFALSPAPLGYASEWVITGSIIRASSTTYRININNNIAGTNLAYSKTTGTVTNYTGTNVFKISGTGGASADITAQSGYLEFKPAAL